MTNNDRNLYLPLTSPCQGQHRRYSGTAGIASDYASILLFCFFPLSSFKAFAFSLDRGALLDMLCPDKQTRLDSRGKPLKTRRTCCFGDSVFRVQSAGKQRKDSQATYLGITLFSRSAKFKMKHRGSRMPCPYRT